MKRKGQGISAPISGEPEQMWFAPGTASIEHPVTKVSLKPRPPADKEIPIAESQDPRAVLADWMTNPKNPHFAHAIVNRVWSSFMGRGIVDPVDDFRASNPPTNPALLDWLAADFVQHGYDLKHLMRTIMRSQIYRLSSLPNETNAADLKNYSRSYRRRLPAETLLDAVCAVTEVKETFSGMPPDARKPVHGRLWPPQRELRVPLRTRCQAQRRSSPASDEFQQAPGDARQRQRPGGKAREERCQTRADYRGTLSRLLCTPARCRGAKTSPQRLHREGCDTADGGRGRAVELAELGGVCV
jgi:hypothetical protein